MLNQFKKGDVVRLKNGVHPTIKLIAVEKLGTIEDLLIESYWQDTCYVKKGNLVWPFFHGYLEFDKNYAITKILNEVLDEET